MEESLSSFWWEALGRTLPETLSTLQWTPGVVTFVVLVEILGLARAWKKQGRSAAKRLLIGTAQAAAAGAIAFAVILLWTLFIRVPFLMRQDALAREAESRVGSLAGGHSDAGVVATLQGELALERSARSSAEQRSRQLEEDAHSLVRVQGELVAERGARQSAERRIKELEDERERRDREAERERVHPLISATKSVTQTVKKDGPVHVVTFAITLHNSTGFATTGRIVANLYWNGQLLKPQPDSQTLGFAPKDSMQIHPSANLSPAAYVEFSSRKGKLTLHLTVEYADRGSKTVYTFAGEADATDGPVIVTRHDWSR